jgi:hypothetical protein
MVPLAVALSWGSHTHAPANQDRWCVLGVLTLEYAINIADRYSISTLIEPIRIEL